MKKRLLWGALALLVLIVAYEYQPARYYALYCLDENAEQAGQWNSKYDGYFLGENGCFYNPENIAIEDIPALHTKNTNKNVAPLWYINGANLRADWVHTQMHRIAYSSGRPVIAIYNSTLGGRFIDAPGDAINGSLATSTAEKVILDALSQEKDIYFQVNSQGAMHMRKVLRNIVTGVEAEQLANIHVLTVGGAASDFPDGPTYVHLVNESDPVPSGAGVLSEGAKPGLHAEIIRFSAKDPNPMERGFRFFGPVTTIFLSVHGLMVYQSHFPSSFMAAPERTAQQAP